MLSNSDKELLDIIVDVFMIGHDSFVVADRVSDLVFEADGSRLEELFKAIAESISDDMKRFLLDREDPNQVENISIAIMDYDEMTDGQKLKQLERKQKPLTVTETFLWLELKHREQPEE